MVIETTLEQMFDALQTFGVEWNNDHCELVNAAWDIAKRHEFKEAPCES